MSDFLNRYDMDTIHLIIGDVDIDTTFHLSGQLSGIKRFQVKVCMYVRGPMSYGIHFITRSPYSL